MNINRYIKEASDITPDPEKSLNNLERFCVGSAEFLERHEKDIIAIASLFSYSQFLADYCISRPEKLGLALRDIGKQVSKRDILATARNTYRDSKDIPFI